MSENLFTGVKDESDLQRIADDIISSCRLTVGDFDKKAWNMYYMMLLAYVFYELPEERTADAVYALMKEAGEVDFVDEDHLSELSFCKKFVTLKERDKNHVAVKYYDAFMLGSINTIRDVACSAGNIFTDYIGTGIVSGKGINGFG